jgi:hypothetical protein
MHVHPRRAACCLLYWTRRSAMLTLAGLAVVLTFETAACQAHGVVCQCGGLLELLLQGSRMGSRASITLWRSNWALNELKAIDISR